VIWLFSFSFAFGQWRRHGSSYVRLQFYDFILSVEKRVLIVQATTVLHNDPRMLVPWPVHTRHAPACGKLRSWVIKVSVWKVER
jgi:hypothetical protein